MPTEATEVDLLPEYRRLVLEVHDLQLRAREATELLEHLAREETRVTERLGVVEAKISSAMRGPPGRQPTSEPVEVATPPAPATPQVAAPALPSPTVVGEGAGTPRDDGRPSPVPPRVAPPPPEGLSKAMWELLLAIPRDGEIRLDALRHRLDLTEAAINNRLMKAKQAKLVKSCGWGQYELTDEGRRLTGLRLHVVGGG